MLRDSQGTVDQALFAMKMGISAQAVSAMQIGQTGILAGCMYPQDPQETGLAESGRLSCNYSLLDSRPHALHGH